jgi:hypothetical protein
MAIKTKIFNKDDLPDHLHEEIRKFSDAIFLAVMPYCKDKNSLNYIMAALSWVSFICIKEFVADHHQEMAILNQAQSILKNLELFKDRDFLKEAMEVE